MNRLVLLIISFLITTVIKAQPFEGKITYKNVYKSKVEAISDEQLNSMMGNVQAYSIKDGNFKSVTNGRFVQWQLYINKENKLYNKLATSEILYWMDVSANGEEIEKSEVKKNALTILGYSCDELTLVVKSGTQKYYYNSKLAADPSLFTNFKFGNWYEYISRSKALPLKMIIETPQFILESIALEVAPATLEAATFTLPEGTLSEKSPY